MAHKPTGLWFVYALPPIDFFRVAPLFSDYIAEDGVLGFTKDERSLDEALLADAKSAVLSTTFWEGDIREGPYVVLVPNELYMTIGAFVWKHDNNGDTFVASLFPMPWLDRHHIPSDPTPPVDRPF